MNIAVRSNWAVRVLLAEGVESVELYSKSLSPETLYLAVHCEDLDSSVSVELQQQGKGGCKRDGVVVESGVATGWRGCGEGPQPPAPYFAAR